MADLTGRTIVVTGGAGGIGRAACARLLADGAAVAMLDLDVAAARATIEELDAPDGRVAAIACDVGDEESVRGAVAEAVATFGAVDGLFANAGIPTRGALHELDLAEWERGLRVNLTGVFLSIKHVLPHLRESGRGAIVTTGSVSSVVATKGGGGPSYKAAKGGVNLLTKSVAVEYAEWGVRANCVCPGAVDTGFGAASTPATGPVAGLAALAPLRRRALPEEVASVVSFLLSDDASYVTGTTVMVDGGYTAT